MKRILSTRTIRYPSKELQITRKLSEEEVTLAKLETLEEECHLDLSPSNSNKMQQHNLATETMDLEWEEVLVQVNLPTLDQEELADSQMHIWQAVLLT